jgi:hypothetical protein
VIFPNQLRPIARSKVPTKLPILAIGKLAFRLPRFVARCTFATIRAPLTVHLSEAWAVSRQPAGRAHLITLRRPEDLARYQEGLRKAGLPE